METHEQYVASRLSQFRVHDRTARPTADERARDKAFPLPFKRASTLNLDPTANAAAIKAGVRPHFVALA